MKSYLKNLKNNMRGLFLPNEEYGIQKSVIFYVVILILFQLILTFIYTTDNSVLLMLSDAVSNIIGLIIGFLIFWIIYALIMVLIFSIFMGIKKDKKKESTSRKNSNTTNTKKSLKTKK